MTASMRRAGLLLFAVVAIGIVAWNLVPAPSSNDRAPATMSSPGSVGVVAVPSRAAQEPAQVAGAREYALALDELQGFPPDLAPGAAIELWVRWDRPSGAAPKLQRLIPRADFVRLVAPVTPGGPTAVVVRVPLRRVPDLLWADGYGSLSATVLP
jgi:hypothetical protein